MESGGTFQTQRTQPSGRVPCVWVKGIAGKWGNTPDAKNATMWSHSLRLGGRGHREGCQ